MNAAARELGLIAAAKAKEPILERARQMRAEQGLKPHPALYPVLVLGAGDRA